jgi:predicted Zn-dependent peptidase
MTTKTTTAVLLALAVAASPARAQKEAPPAPGAPKGFQVPAPRVLTLDNGLRVTLVPYGTVPKVRVELSVRVGNVNEGPKEVWLADIMGDLLREGTTTRTATEVSQAAARMGGSLEVTVGPDRTEIAGDVLPEFGPEFARLVADVARNPRWPADELPRLKADRLRQLSIASTQPQQLALEKFRAVLYPDHPYGRVFPTPEMVQGYTVDQVRGFYDANFGAARAHLYVVGRFEAGPIEAAVRAAFGDWKKGAAASAPVATAKSTRAVHVVDRPSAPQSTILLGMPVIDPSKPDYVPLVVTNALLGGAFSSRITANIREQKGYTYSPNSQVSTRFRDAYWAEQADVTTNVTGPSLKEIFYEIDRLQKEPPAAAELKGIQNYLAGVFVLQNASREGIINQLEFVDLHGLPETYLNDYVKRVYAVTPADVQRIASTYIQADKATIVVVGDTKVIEEQVAPYGPVSK